MLSVSSATSVPVLSARPRNIAELAESCLRANSYLALKNIDCKYQDGVLTLKGCLPSYYLKQIAQTAVARIEGVERICNEIVVTASAPLSRRS